MNAARFNLSLLGAALLCGLAFLYFASKVFLDASPSVDFKYFWLAGDLWRQGLDPYGDGFREAGARLFPDTNSPTWFVYPPSWYPLARVASVLPYEQADLAWRWVSGVVLPAT